MTGISEILILILLIACILIIPRMFKAEPTKKTSSSKKLTKLTAKIRLGIVLSIVYPILMAIYLKPWHVSQVILYISYGIMPVLLVWAFIWILAGRKK